METIVGKLGEDVEKATREVLKLTPSLPSFLYRNSSDPLPGTHSSAYSSLLTFGPRNSTPDDTFWSFMTSR